MKPESYDYEYGLEKIRRVFDFDNGKYKILDLGCGDGRLDEVLIKKGHEVWGVDESDKALQLAEEKGVKIIKTDLEKPLAIEDKSFDVILILDILEHLYNQKNILKEAHRILKDEGRIIISYPNHFDLRNRLNILLGKGIIHWAHKKYENVNATEYVHIRFLLFKELVDVLKQAGFYLEVVQFNFMAGGIIPRRLTPAWLRKILLKKWPQLLTGKYVVVCSKNENNKVRGIYLPRTNKNF